MNQIAQQLGRLYFHVAGYLGVDCSVPVSSPPVITGIRTGPVCDVRGPNPCTFVSLFLTQFTFLETFSSRFVRILLQLDKYPELCEHYCNLSLLCQRRVNVNQKFLTWLK